MSTLGTKIEQLIDSSTAIINRTAALNSDSIPRYADKRALLASINNAIHCQKVALRELAEHFGYTEDELEVATKDHVAEAVARACLQSNQTNTAIKS